MAGLIYQEEENLYRIVPLQVLRRTEGASFDLVPREALAHIDGIDRVIHAGGASSPGAVGDVKRPWYMHPYQDDNLVVLHGTRYVDIYTRTHGRMESFTVSPHRVMRGDEVVYDGAAMLVWPRGVFHRILSCSEEGSASLNLAVRYPGLDMRTNFNVYDLNTETGDYHCIREGHLDQP